MDYDDKRMRGNAAESIASEQMKAWAPMLGSMYDVTLAAINRNGGKGGNDALAQAVVLDIAQFFGGKLVYIPRGENIKRELRDQEIAKRLGREKANDLAAEYRLSVQTIYAIARKQQKLRKRSGGG